MKKAIYGTLGQYTSLLYNINVATSITSQGRAMVSSMTLHFEMMLGDNVKFGSLDEVLQFINNIISEAPNRKFDDRLILNHFVTVDECFAKIVLECGYRWIPDDTELDIIYRVISSLSQTDLNRVYYKNNLYEFIDNEVVFNLIRDILKSMDKPLMNSLDIPANVAGRMKLLSDYIYEYVYYRYLFIDRTDRCDNMIKSIVMVSDTDSTIISLDAWYRFIINKLNGEEFRIANYCPDPVTFIQKNEDGDWTSKPWEEAVKFEPKRLDYNFMTDEIEEAQHQSHPDILTPNDNMRYSIINMLAYILDRTVNDYMEKTCENMHSLHKLPDGSYDRSCRIIAKNEFLFKRLMMTMVKKNYASLIAVQEGNIVPENKQLDVKGIEALTKSSKPISTRKALQKILLEDILKAPVIDQMRFIKDIAIFEHQIVESVRKGSKEYYKPATIKSSKAYSDPMRIQGIKASEVWNKIHPSELPAINLEERNAIDIAKVNINEATAIKIREKYPEIYSKIMEALSDDMFKPSAYRSKIDNLNKEIDCIINTGYTTIEDKNKDIKHEKQLTEEEARKIVAKDRDTIEKLKAKNQYGSIDAVAIPLDVNLPEWLEPFIDYDSIISDNISGFPYESIGIQRMNKPINYSNIVTL